MNTLQDQLITGLRGAHVHPDLRICERQIRQKTRAHPMESFKDFLSQQVAFLGDKGLQLAPGYVDKSLYYVEKDTPAYGPIPAIDSPLSPQKIKDISVWAVDFMLGISAATPYQTQGHSIDDSITIIQHVGPGDAVSQGLLTSLPQELQTGVFQPKVHAPAVLGSARVASLNSAEEVKRNAQTTPWKLSDFILTDLPAGATLNTRQFANFKDFAALTGAVNQALDAAALVPPSERTSTWKYPDPRVYPGYPQTRQEKAVAIQVQNSVFDSLAQLQKVQINFQAQTDAFYKANPPPQVPEQGDIAVLQDYINKNNAWWAAFSEGTTQMLSSCHAALVAACTSAAKDMYKLYGTASDYIMTSFPIRYTSWLVRRVWEAHAIYIRNVSTAAGAVEQAKSQAEALTAAQQQQESHSSFWSTFWQVLFFIAAVVVVIIIIISTQSDGGRVNTEIQPAAGVGNAFPGEYPPHQ